MAEEKDVVELREKVARAAQLLLYRRHMQPGVKAWELKRDLGRNYAEILKVLDGELQKLGLTVKKVSEGEEGSESVRYFVTMRGHPPVSEVRTFGWRIDDMAILAVSLSYILSKRGKAPLKEVERILGEKFPRWRVEQDIDRFIRRGYLEEDDEGVLYVGWRTRAEVDQKALLGLLLGREKKGKESEGQAPK
ncbi:MAG: hypothetical protein AVW06_03670 [Hadesarchaea archaeon DG-33-1]|nr:MAG: hypothetical protein AVW06_03670 [Hadesarchaea archaeon DG-33-1]